MKLNCDLGESEENWLSGHDKALLQYVDMVNVSCGVHAGNPKLTQETLREAIFRGKEIGAHPSYNDREHFGRKSLNIGASELFDTIYGQLYNFQNWCEVRVNYVKPHGALYHDCMNKPEVLSTLIAVMKELNLNVPIMLMAGFQSDYPIIAEGFVDRKYRSAFELVPRSMPNSIITNSEEALSQYIQLSHSMIGQKNIYIESLCIHSDTPNVLEIAKEIAKYKSNKPD